ncbi:hypothetical protein [Microbacterium sp. Marseille-Q6965]|uniref:hypothetical protein n=1 Tax=Microbacterium sp. Marseille-Q6965 TaxID=2965072 RepID=UPI0021B7943B|nr:hypothetical protein [Microbacterium sp. Marseille-Q6965]
MEESRKAAPRTARDALLEDHAQELRSQAAEMLAETDLLAVLRRYGDVAVMGSFVSDLMTHPEIDIAVHVGAAFTLARALRVAESLDGVVPLQALTITDERGEASPGDEHDERFHLVAAASHRGVGWTLDVSLFLHDVHANVRDWHEKLQGSLTPNQRSLILAIKSALHDAPDYPGSLAIYKAVLAGQASSVDDLLSYDRPATPTTGAP